MAFNFNWKPLTADAHFYRRARDLLTMALNKTPKPPIIVDDIIVTEFNLGTTPPDLEILEIGDLAEDRFRGIFKMCYSGDAFLTLKTRVQANPMNTYLYSKPIFTSPQPLAAAQGLTIPLQITLSEIKLSAFIILVFSKQKGLTLVFRNDPLESLKVSSTFDSIQFVRDYLQRTIEGKLRDLMMDELPATIHRLSLQLWCGGGQGSRTDVTDEGDAALNPLESPPLDAVDALGCHLDHLEITNLSLDSAPELQTLFSQQNLWGIATAARFHRCLSLCNPKIPGSMPRLWAMQQDQRSDGYATPQFSRQSPNWYSLGGGSTTHTFSDTISQNSGQMSSRSSLVSLNLAANVFSRGSGRSTRTAKRKKRRVVDLRSKPIKETGQDVDIADSSETASVDGPVSEPILLSSIPEPEDDLFLSNPSRGRFTDSVDESRPPPKTSVLSTQTPQTRPTPSALIHAPKQPPTFVQQPSENTLRITSFKELLTSEWSRRKPQYDASSMVWEQAWVSKMAGEIARRVYDERNRIPGIWEGREDVPPPYEAT